MATMREYMEDNRLYSVTAARFAADGGPAEEGDRISSYRITTDTQGREADLYLINHAYGVDAYGRDLLSESNFDYLTENHGEELVTVAFLNVDQLAVLATTEVTGELLEILEGLADYPVIDEGDFCQREWEYKEECWKEYGRWEFRHEIALALGPSDLGWLVSDRDVLSDDDLDQIMGQAVQDGEVDEYIESGGGAVWAGLVDVAEVTAERVAAQAVVMGGW